MRSATDKNTSKPRRRRSGSTVDPRMRARRIDVQRTEGRRRLRTLVALVVITAASVASLVLIQSSWLDVDRVAVNGAVRTDPAAVIDAAGFVVGEPLVELDSDGAVTRVQSLPWVGTAEVDRGWNGDVTVVITEREPLLALPAPGGHVLIDRDGRQLELVAERPFGFMPVAGLTASGQPGEPAPAASRGVIRLLDEIRPELELEVSQVVADSGNLYLDLRSGGRVRLGSEAGMADKLLSLETLLVHVDLRCLWEIDIRVPSAPAITRVSGSGEPGVALTDLTDCS